MNADFDLHMDMEEMVLFPMIRAAMVSAPIAAMQAEHMNAAKPWPNLRRSPMTCSPLRAPPAPGEVIVLEKTPADFLHVVVSGSVELFARYRNQETEFALIEPPQKDRG